MSKTKTAAINYAASGSTVKGAVKLLDDEFDIVYTHLNTMYKMQYADTEPTDKNTGDVWIDSLPSPRLMIYNGSAFVPLVQRVLGQSTAPTGPNSNDLWFDPDPYAILKYYNTANTTWVNVTYGLPVGLFHAYASNASVTFTHGSTIVCVHDTEIADTCGWYNVSTGRYTPQLAGWYEVHGSVAMPKTGTDGTIYVDIFLNGSTLVSRTSARLIPSTGGADAYLSTSAWIALNGTTDYLTVRALQINSASSNLTNIASAGHDTSFRGRYLGAAQTGSLL